jgi:hypothetical protein
LHREVDRSCWGDGRVKQAIRNAFPDGQPPERPITECFCIECVEIDAIMGGHVWSDFADDFPQYCDVYCLLNAPARAYYLPAYLLAAIGPHCGMQDVSIQSALEDGRLTPEEFTPDQRSVIARWAKENWWSSGVPVEQVLAKWSASKIPHLPR